MVGCSLTLTISIPKIRCLGFTSVLTETFGAEPYGSARHPDG